MTVTILKGDCRDVLRTLPDESVHCVVTSPPYFGLRDYGVAGQIGLEASLDDFVDKIVSVFCDVRRVLRADGTLWLNMGDSYASGGRKSRDPGQSKIHPAFEGDAYSDGLRPADPEGIKPKDLLGVPWAVAFALRADGWYLRSDIIWSKPNPMPESVIDRPTKAHEYLFLLSKGEKYHYDADAIKEVAVGPAGGNVKPNKSFEHDPVKHRTKAGLAAAQARARRSGGFESRNKRSVWEVVSQPFNEAHFATFPAALIEPCILAGCPKEGVVLDPFGGAGTTGLVADRLGRNAILIELNPEYAAMAERRIRNDAGMFAEVV